MDKGITLNLRSLCPATLVNYILEEIKENLLTSSSKAKASAWIDLLQAAQFIASR
jgi:hypothetical protein